MRTARITNSFQINKQKVFAAHITSQTTMKKPWQRGTIAIVLTFSLAGTIYSLNQAESLLIDVRYLHRRSNSFRILRLRSHNNKSTNIPTDSGVPFEKKVRKRRKNKYENFSRVEADSDPLDTLIEESNRMNNDIVAEINSTKQKLKTNVAIEIPSIPNKVFPDIKTIDVSSIKNDVILISVSISLLPINFLALWSGNVWILVDWNNYWCSWSTRLVKGTMLHGLSSRSSLFGWDSAPESSK